MSNRQSRLPLEQKFRDDLAVGKTVIAAVSGGADSMALLHRLYQTGVTVIVAHLNHCLRGEESDRDENFVRDFCSQLHVPFFSRRVDIAALCRREGLGEEECGRRERYAFFEELRRDMPSETVVATAHTLSDQLETILFRMARGTGLYGLCGIPAERDGIIRPLIGCTRQDVEEYCQRWNVPFILDSTNSDPHYARNRIRLEAIPALKQVNAAIELHTGQLVQSLTADSDYLEQKANALFHQVWEGDKLSVGLTFAAHPALTMRVLAYFLGKNNVSADYALLNRITELGRQPRGTVNLPGNRRIIADGGYLWLEQAESKEDNPWNTEVLLPKQPEFGKILARFPLPDGNFLLCLPESVENFEKRKKIYNSDLIFSLDYDTIVGRLSFRCKSAGDRIRLMGRQGSRPLKKLYSEARLPLRYRQSAVVALDDQDVVWAEHIGPAGRNIPAETTSRLLLLIVTARKEIENYDGK